jgi:hypothetical protein
MTIDEAIAIVKDEAAFCRSLAEKDGDTIGGDFSTWSNRKAEAQDMLIAEYGRLANTLRGMADSNPFCEERDRNGNRVGLSHGNPVIDASGYRIAACKSLGIDPFLGMKGAK